MILTPTFNGKKLRAMTPVIDKLIEKTSQSIEKLSLVGINEINIYPIYRKMALEIIASNAFGIQLDQVFEKFSGASSAAQKILKAADIASRPNLSEPMLVLNMLFPEFTFIIHPIRKFITTVLEYLDMNANGVLFHFCDKILKQRRASSKRRDDLLQSLLEARLNVDAVISEADLTMTSDINDNVEEAKAKLGKQFRSLTDMEVVSSAFLFLLAGYETTSTALAYISHTLINNPEWQEKLREEASALIEKEGSLNYNTVNELPLMEAFINETLRIYSPVAPFTSRLSATDFRYKDIIIPKGTGIYVGVMELHRDPSFWEKPETFDPRRFVDDKSKANSIMFQVDGRLASLLNSINNPNSSN